MSWLTQPQRKRPKDPPHVDLVHLIAAGDAMKARGEPVPHIEYIKAFGPKATVDEWGSALPLSSVAQFDLDRLVAILLDPLTRGKELLLSGALNPDEVSAMRAVYPQVWQALVSASTMDMMQTKPPYANWAQNVLGVLFQKPANQAYSEAKAPQGPSSPPMGNAPSVGLPNSIPTPTDRMETAVREAARS